ncbi:AAA family ATPase [uncultured Sphingomonas sp.]|uniref:AAA family ATPase n=1 Tax=uncultured Sphingomonas sp. TaxID=158754 RepID=UPI0026367D15|nr:AAA family ATPase [uncultured Sphingomonas sp.]
MTVKDADGGDVVFYSHNGGDWRAVKDECRRLGLIPERPRANDNCDRGDRTLRARDVAAWEYTDAEGVVLYRKVRMALPNGGKSYRFEHPDGRGGWKAKRGNAAQVPYRLPDIVAAEHAAILYMAEGEKQADKLASWGFLATSSKDWRSFEFSGYVKDRTVVILPDNDEEGARIAESAREAVERAEGRAIILTLPDLPAKGDIMDWSGGADDLRRLTAAALQQPAAILPIADLAAWARSKASPTPFYMAGYIPAGEVTLLTGAGGGNKSTFGQQLSTCSAAGLAMLGVDVMQGSTLYITAEDDPDRLHWMQEHICRALGVDMASLAGKLHLASIRGRLNNELATFDADGRLKPQEAFQLVRSTIEATGARLIVLDNVAHLFAGNENDRAQVTAFVNLLYVLCRELGVTIVLIAHKNKAGDSYSGSTAWLNAVRSQLVLERPEGFDPDARVMTVGKANYARPDQQLAFRWHDFALILDTDLPDDRRAELAATIAASASNSAFLACLAERNKQRRHVSEKPTASNYAPKQFEGMPEAKGLPRKQLEDAMDRLFRIGAIERGFLYRDTAEGKDIHGLREASGNPESSPEGSRKVYPESSGNPHLSTGNTPPYTTYNGAAPSGSAAPSRENENTGVGTRGEILAPNEQPTRGWLS